MHTRTRQQNRKKQQQSKSISLCVSLPGTRHLEYCVERWESFVFFAKQHGWTQSSLAQFPNSQFFVCLWCFGRSIEMNLFDHDVHYSALKFSEKQWHDGKKSVFIYLYFLNNYILTDRIFKQFHICSYLFNFLNTISIYIIADVEGLSKTIQPIHNHWSRFCTYHKPDIPSNRSFARQHSFSFIGWAAWRWLCFTNASRTDFAFSVSRVNKVLMVVKVRKSLKT